MILFKNFKCPYCSFLSKVSLEIVFGGVLDRKQAFLDYKNINFRLLQSEIFPNGLVHYLGQNRPRNSVSVMFLIEKSPFCTIKV